MHQSEINPADLRQKVEVEFTRYASAYEPPALRTSYGVSWSKEKVSSEIEKMAALLVEPYIVEYESGDDLLPIEDRLLGLRSAFVVAEDGCYLLLFDFEAENFVLASKHENGRLTAWGIRGDATSTFLAR